MLNPLPEDWERAVLVGRIEFEAGPTPVVIRSGRVFDVSRSAPTVSELLNRFESAASIPEGVDAGQIEDLGLTPTWERSGNTRLLAPVDLQCIKAAGVTFAVSALERVIEEQARGDASKAHAIRAALCERVGSDLSSVQPGSNKAEQLKQALIADGLWSQYLEVAIGPDAEVFTKAPILSAVGWGEYAGVRSDSAWNNPEPEIVVVCDSLGRARGATLGNDVNLRDFEGRSALLLGKAKDNNASCAIGPFIRLFDGDVRPVDSDAGKGPRSFASGKEDARFTMDDKPRPAGIDRAIDRQTSPVPGWLCALPRNDVRANSGPRHTRRWFHSQDWRPRPGINTKARRSREPSRILRCGAAMGFRSGCLDAQPCRPRTSEIDPALDFKE
jgi:fumarylacetoacetate (FAA) hydrolase family protein